MTGEKRDYEIGKTLKRKRINGEERERKKRKKGEKKDKKKKGKKMR